MNRPAILFLSAMILSAAPAAAQQSKALVRGPATPPVFYEFKNLDAATATSVTQLAAELFHVTIDFNRGMRAAVIRPTPYGAPDWQQKTLDFLKHYDVPPPPEPMVRYVAYLVRASNAKPEDAPVGRPIPKELGDVIAEMKTSLAYARYDLLTTVTSVSQGAATASDTLADLGKSNDASAYTLEYTNVSVAADRKSVSIRPFQFALRHLAFNTVSSMGSNVTVREGQKLVLGKVRMSDVRMSDDADVFVVLTVKVE